MFGKSLSLILWLNAKMFSSNQIAGFLNFNISKTIGGIKSFFLRAGTHLLKLQSDDIIWVGVPRHA